MGGHRLGRGAAGLVLGLACLAGCQGAGRPAPDLFGSGGPAGQADLGPRQVADVKIAVGRTLENRGQAEQARAAYAEALKADPGRADACLRLAVLSDQQGKFGESAELYRKALALRPGDPDIYCDVGYSFYLQRRWPEAEMNLRQALALRPDHRRAHNNLGLVLAHVGRDEEALAEFRSAGNGEADARANLAFALVLEHRWPEARQQYELARASDPNSAILGKEVEALDAVLARADPAPHPRAPEGGAAPPPAPPPAAVLPAGTGEGGGNVRPAVWHPVTAVGAGGE